MEMLGQYLNEKMTASLLDRGHSHFVLISHFWLHILPPVVKLDD